eukprot:105644-Pyramimonas_sp.AAC.1
MQSGPASTNYLVVDGSFFSSDPAGSGWAMAHVLANDDRSFGFSGAFWSRAVLSFPGLSTPGSAIIAELVGVVWCLGWAVSTGVEGKVIIYSDCLAAIDAALGVSSVSSAQVLSCTAHALYLSA